MNTDIELVYSAKNEQELLEALKVNPNINEIPRDNMDILNYYILYTYQEVSEYCTNSNVKILNEKTFLNMLELLLKAGAETKESIFFSLMWSPQTHNVKIKIARLLLDYGAKFNLNIHQIREFTIFEPDVYNFIVEGYPLEKLKEKMCARIIQKWFLKMYYDPYHPYGKRRLESEFASIEKELSKYQK